VEGLYTHALLERNEMISSIEKISFGEGFSLNEGYTRLIIKTKTGVEMDIYKPEQNLAEKLNICFSTYNDEDFTSEQKTQGVIKIYLDKFGNEKIGYFEPTE